MTDQTSGFETNDDCKELQRRIAEALADATGARWPAQAFLTEAAAALDALKPELDALADWEQQRARADRAEAKIADYENRITWGTSCGACARILDSSIRETERADRAEAELRRYTEADSADAAVGSYATRAEQAERERDEARQHAAAIAAQRDRLRQRMNTLADRWETALPVDKPYARTLRNEISVAPFDPDGAMAVQEYTERGRRLWAFRCWGTDTCDGWLGLGHHTQTSALLERERHVAEEHAVPGVGSEHVALVDKPGPSETWSRAAGFDQHNDYRSRYTAMPVDPEAERAATERARQAAVDGERAAEQLAKLSAPTPAPTEAADGSRSAVASETEPNTKGQQ